MDWDSVLSNLEVALLTLVLTAIVVQRITKFAKGLITRALVKYDIIEKKLPSEVQMLISLVISFLICLAFSITLDIELPFGNTASVFIASVIIATGSNYIHGIIKAIKELREEVKNSKK